MSKALIDYHADRARRRNRTARFFPLIVGAAGLLAVLPLLWSLFFR